MNAPCRYLVTTSPVGERESGFGSFGEGFHLLVIPVFVLRSESITVASSVIPPSQWRLGLNNTALVAKPVSASHANGPNAVLMVWESLHFRILEQTELYSLPIYRPDAKACTT